MGCDITKGRKITVCKDSIAGIKNIYILNWADADYNKFKWVEVTPATVPKTYTTTLDTMTGIKPMLAASVRIPSYKFELIRGGTFEQVGAVDKKTGSSFFDQSLKFDLGGLTAVDDAELNKLVKAKVRILVEYYVPKGQPIKYVLMGEESGADIKLTASSGAEMADFVGYHIECVAQESNLASTVLATMIGKKKATYTASDLYEIAVEDNI